jgi:serine/threonine protein kinase
VRLLTCLSRHSRVKQANILVDNTGTARVADFGLMTMTDLSTIVLSKTTDSSGGTLNWMSPELLDPQRFGSDGRLTRESDCYALGMVIYEVSRLHRCSRWSFAHPSQVLTGLRPFHHVIAFTPVLAIMEGDRPRKPLYPESLGFSDALWELTQSCWSESASTRPTARQLFDYLSPASLTWVPPLVYPAVVGGTPSVADVDSPGLMGTSPVVSQGVGTISSIGGSACRYHGAISPPLYSN